MQFFLVIPGLIWLKKSILVLLAGVGVLIGVGAAGATILSYESPVPNAAAILTSIQEPATLITELATFDIYVSTGIVDGFKGANSYSGDFEGIGEIHAGIDLTEMTEADIIVENDGYIIHLPPAKFTTCVLSNFQQTSHSVSLLGVDWNQLYEFATIDAYHSLTHQGVTGGILDLAEQKAGEIIKGIVYNLTERETKIVYRLEGRGDGSDPRCTPEFPQGWGKEDLNYNWVRLPS